MNKTSEILSGMATGFFGGLLVRTNFQGIAAEPISEQQMQNLNNVTMFGALLIYFAAYKMPSAFTIGAAFGITAQFVADTTRLFLDSPITKSGFGV